MDKATNILIVDDSEDDSVLVAHQLRRIVPDAKFRRVDTEDDMAAALRESDWDLVISDHSMPRFDSVRAMEVLRAARSDVPFIVFSGHYDQDKGIAAMGGGAEDFVYKSNPQRLIPVVQRELRNAQIRRAKAEAERAAQALSMFDELTQLPNRNLLAQSIRACLADGPPAVVMVLDIDRFMRINDSFGFATGDALLRQVAARLEARIEAGDVVARLDADHFACLMHGTGACEAPLARAEALLGAFRAPYQQNGQELFLTASVGCALAPVHGADADTLLRNAESAMASAKRNGRNRAETYDPERQNGASMRLQLESALHHAVPREELFLLYQPMLEVSTGKIGAVEALVRWRHERFGVVPPDQFIPLADETGHIIEIGEWVLRRACRQAKYWHQRGLTHLVAAVNFSAAQFRDVRLVDRVRGALSDAGLPANALEIEITETVAMQDAEHSIAAMGALKSMGVRLAIDDFGTGYSSLSYLRRFPIDVLKIDRAFIKNLPDDLDDLNIVRTVVALARALRISVVAEGVETEAQSRLLAAEGVDRLQGFWLSRPAPPESLAGLLRTTQVVGAAPVAAPPKSLEFVNLPRAVSAL